MKKRAWTLTEVLVVIAIIAIMAAITYPVFKRVKWQSYKTVCFSNLHQIGINMTLYRSNWNGGDVGTSDQLGLPDDPVLLTDGLLCPLHAPITSHHFLPSYNYLYEVPVRNSQASRSWDKIEAHFLGKTIIYSDFNHNDPSVYGKKYFNAYAIGLELDGGVRTRVSPALNAGFPDWWYTK